MDDSLPSNCYNNNIIKTWAIWIMKEFKMSETLKENFCSLLCAKHTFKCYLQRCPSILLWTSNVMGDGIITG